MKKKNKDHATFNGMTTSFGGGGGGGGGGAFHGIPKTASKETKNWCHNNFLSRSVEFFASRLMNEKARHKLCKEWVPFSSMCFVIFFHSNVVCNHVYKHYT